MADNTGYIIWGKLKKVVNGGANDGQPLDVNNNLTSVSLLPQESKDNNASDADYVNPVYDETECPLTVRTYTFIKSADFQKNNCLDIDETGSVITYNKTYTSNISYNDAKDNVAANDTATFNTEGQTNANSQGTCTPPFQSDEIGIIVVDVYNNTDLYLLAYCDVEETSTYRMPIYTGNNFLPNNNTPPANCWMLASDVIGGSGVLKWRFEFNVARYMSAYPNVEEFNFVIKGSTSTESNILINGVYSLKGADAGNMTMTGSQGSYIPSVQSSSTIRTTAYSNKYVECCGTNYDILKGEVIMIYKYIVATKELILL